MVLNRYSIGPLDTEAIDDLQARIQQHTNYPADYLFLTSKYFDYNMSYKQDIDTIKSLMRDGLNPPIIDAYFDPSVSTIYGGDCDDFSLNTMHYLNHMNIEGYPGMVGFFSKELTEGRIIGHGVPALLHEDNGLDITDPLNILPPQFGGYPKILRCSNDTFVVADLNVHMDKDAVMIFLNEGQAEVEVLFSQIMKNTFQYVPDDTNTKQDFLDYVDTFEGQMQISSGLKTGTITLKSKGINSAYMIDSCMSEVKPTIVQLPLNQSLKIKFPDFPNTCFVGFDGEKFKFQTLIPNDQLSDDHKFKLKFVGEHNSLIDLLPAMRELRANSISRLLFQPTNLNGVIAPALSGLVSSVPSVLIALLVAAIAESFGG
jgi:hypothetical protein